MKQAGESCANLRFGNIIDCFGEISCKEDKADECIELGDMLILTRRLITCGCGACLHRS